MACSVRICFFQYFRVFVQWPQLLNHGDVFGHLDPVSPISKEDTMDDPGT